MEGKKLVNEMNDEAKDHPTLFERLSTWLINSALFAILPLFISFFSQPTGHPFFGALQRGDAFIITTALIAPELAEIQLAKKRTSGTILVQCLLLVVVVLGAIMFVISTANYAATHPETTIATGEALPYTSFDPSSRSAPIIPFQQLSDPGLLSLAFLLCGVLLVITSIILRHRNPRRINQ
jgi:hypothetical protein